MSPHALHFLAGPGECRATARAFDWTTTPLGAPETWSNSLKTTVGILFNSRHPMFLWWGQDLIQIYNDAYRPSFGVGKHPAAMGQRGRECWQEIWPIIAPQIKDVMVDGKASWNVDQLVPIYRNGRIEEVYWTYGYSPVFEDDGSIGGALVVCTETTKRVLGERRLAALRALSARLQQARELSEVASALLEVLTTIARDVPFALVYSAGPPASIGLDPGAKASLDTTLKDRLDRAERLSISLPVYAGPWPEASTEVFVVPIEAASRQAIVCGLSPRLPFDSTYRTFLLELVDQTAIARARIRFDNERRGLLEQAPVATALMVGPDHVFEIANSRFCEMAGRDVLGKSYVDAFPELSDGPLRQILDRVYRFGEPFVTHEMLISFDVQGDGALEDRFFKFNLEPIRNADGVVYGMMAIAIDITEQVIARRTLEKTDQEREALLRQAEAAGRAKDEFLAMLGHELRNPLAPIVTALEVLKLKDGVQNKREHEIIERQATHLIHLVDDLLDVSRVAQGKIELKKARILLSDVVARAVEMVTPLFERKVQTLRVDVPTVLEIDADPVRLRQVVANLLTNAAKYTPERGHVAVTGSLEDEEIVLRIEDNGVGISAEQVPHLFEAFFQGPRSSERSEGGLGLGLALVSSLMTLHGGTVRAHSGGVGSGSVFELRLPALTSAPTPSEREAPVTRTSRPPKSTRVLLVDDNEDLVEMFAMLLANEGFDVRTAHDGPSALEIASAFHPEIAILDIGLPVMDGYELASHLRERLGTAAPRMIAMTGYGQEQARAQGEHAGFERHLVKPVDGETLIATIMNKG